MTYCWKAVDKGYNFASNPILIRGLHTKLWTPKVAGVSLPTGSPETKCHLGVGPVAMHKVYYKGEGGGFPLVWALVNSVSPCLPMVRPCTKSI